MEENMIDSLMCKAISTEFCWVIGYPYCDGDNVFVNMGDLIPVFVSTVCRCTGRHDAHGNLIFENDLLKMGNMRGFFRAKYDVRQGMWFLYNNGAKWNLTDYELSDFTIEGNIFDENPGIYKIEGGQS